MKGTVPRDVWLFLDEAEGRGIEPGDSYGAMPGGGGDPVRAVPFDYEWVPLVLAHLDVVRSTRGRFARAEAAHALLVEHLDTSRLSPALADYLGIRYAGYQRRAGRETQAAAIEKLLRRAPTPGAGTPPGNDERSGCLRLRDSLPASCVLELLE
jgi:hypothetical protein